MRPTAGCLHRLSRLALLLLLTGCAAQLPSRGLLGGTGSAVLSPLRARRLWRTQGLRQSRSTSRSPRLNGRRRCAVAASNCPGSPRGPPIHVRIGTSSNLRVTAVGFGLTEGGYLLYCEGLPLPVLVPESQVDLGVTSAEPLGVFHLPGPAHRSGGPGGQRRGGRTPEVCVVRGAGRRAHRAHALLSGHHPAHRPDDAGGAHAPGADDPERAEGLVVDLDGHKGASGRFLPCAAGWARSRNSVRSPGRRDSAARSPASRPPAPASRSTRSRTCPRSSSARSGAGFTRAIARAGPGSLGRQSDVRG